MALKGKLLVYEKQMPELEVEFLEEKLSIFFRLLPYAMLMNLFLKKTKDVHQVAFY